MTPRRLAVSKLIDLEQGLTVVIGFWRCIDTRLLGPPTRRYENHEKQHCDCRPCTECSRQKALPFGIPTRNICLNDFQNSRSECQNATYPQLLSSRVQHQTAKECYGRISQKMFGNTPRPRMGSHTARKDRKKNDCTPSANCQSQQTPPHKRRKGEANHNRISLVG